MHIQRTNILAPAIAALAIAAFLLMQDRQGTVYPEALLRADSIVSKQPDSAAAESDLNLRGRTYSQLGYIFDRQ